MKLFVFFPMRAHLVKLLWPFVILKRKFMRLVSFTKRDYEGENCVCAMDPKKCNAKS